MTSLAEKLEASLKVVHESIGTSLSQEIQALDVAIENARLCKAGEVYIDLVTKKLAARIRYGAQDLIGEEVIQLITIPEPEYKKPYLHLARRGYAVFGGTSEIKLLVRMAKLSIELLDDKIARATDWIETLILELLIDLQELSTEQQVLRSHRLLEYMFTVPSFSDQFFQLFSHLPLEVWETGVGLQAKSYIFSYLSRHDAQKLSQFVSIVGSANSTTA